MPAMGAVITTEVRRQLLSPVSWLVVAVFAGVAGAAFIVTLDSFLEASLAALSAPPPRPVNVNQMLIRPFIVQSGLAALLLLPTVTARAFGREYPGSTGAPVSRVAAAFIGVLAVYALMLSASLTITLALFAVGRPEWGPIASGYLGLLLIGAAFIAGALVISSLATSAVAAAAATFAVAVALAAVAWLAESAAAEARPFFERFSIAASLDDFAKGVIDVGHIVSCLTIVGVALIVTRHMLQPHPLER